MQFSSLVADGSSRGDVGMQIAISHEVCAVSRSCFILFWQNLKWEKISILEMGKKLTFDMRLSALLVERACMQFSSLVADGSSRGDVGMQIAISHEVCAVSRSCFFYYGKL